MDQREILKKISHFVFSVSVLSFLAWYSSQNESFKAYFSTFIFSIFTHTLERKYMFLLCNAILAFVATTSSSSSSPTSAFQSNNVESDEQALNLSETPQAPDEEKATNYSVVEEKKKQEEQVSEDKFNIEASIVEEEEDDDDDDDDEEEEEVGIEDHATLMAPNEELVNTEELNRKFEEFIRKIKEEIKIEAQRKLIAAV